MFLNVHVWDFGFSYLSILVRLFLPVLTDSDEWGRENVTDNSASPILLLFADHSHYTQARFSLSEVDGLRSLGEKNVFDKHVVLCAPKFACVLLK
jgi:hypothetical protein